MYCRNCGTKLEDDARFCTSCGTKTLQTQSEQTNRAAVSLERKTNQDMRYEQYPKREKTFGTTPRSRTIALVEVYLFGAVGIALLYVYFTLPSNPDWRMIFYTTAEYQLWLQQDALWEIGVIFVAGAIGRLIWWFELTKINLCIGEEKISGTASAGFVMKKFEYYYDEISDVTTAYSSGIRIQVNGRRWITIHKIEDKKLAEEMLKERLRENYYERELLR